MQFWEYRPLDKQTAVADQGQLGTATEVLKAAESELVTKEVAEQGGVVRGGTAAKVQVCAGVFPAMPSLHVICCALVTGHMMYLCSSQVKAMRLWRTRRQIWEFVHAVRTPPCACTDVQHHINSFRPGVNSPDEKFRQAQIFHSFRPGLPCTLCRADIVLCCADNAGFVLTAVSSRQGETGQVWQGVWHCQGD